MRTFFLSCSTTCLSSFASHPGRSAVPSSFSLTLETLWESGSLTLLENEEFTFLTYFKDGNELGFPEFSHRVTDTESSAILFWTSAAVAASVSPGSNCFKKTVQNLFHVNHYWRVTRQWLSPVGSGTLSTLQYTLHQCRPPSHPTITRLLEIHFKLDLWQMSQREDFPAGLSEPVSLTQRPTTTPDLG